MERPANVKLDEPAMTAAVEVVMIKDQNSLIFISNTSHY